MNHFDEAALRAEHFHGSEIGEFALVPTLEPAGVIWRIYLEGCLLGAATWPASAVADIVSGKFDAQLKRAGHKIGLNPDLSGWRDRPKSDSNRAVQNR